jgi:hypothetical protein
MFPSLARFGGRSGRTGAAAVAASRAAAAAAEAARLRASKPFASSSAPPSTASSQGPSSQEDAQEYLSLKFHAFGRESGLRSVVLKPTAPAAVAWHAVGSVSPEGVLQLASAEELADWHIVAVLAQLHPAFIKADMSIVRGAHLESRKQRLLHLLASFASATGAELVAEGVESEAEADAARRCGVHLLQGYLYGKPCVNTYQSAAL